VSIRFVLYCFPQLTFLHPIPSCSFPLFSRLSFHVIVIIYCLFLDLHLLICYLSSFIYCYFPRPSLLLICFLLLHLPFLFFLLLACNLFTFHVSLCSLSVRFIRRNRRQKARTNCKLKEENSDAINDGGRIGGFKLFELSQSDYRKCEMPIKCQVEAWINKKFKEYLNREVQNVWKVINRRQVIC